MQERKTQKTLKTTNIRVFSSDFTTPALSFAAVLLGNSEQRKQPHLRQDAVGGMITTETSINEQKQERGQTVRTPNVNSLSSEYKLKH
jgi:hypothetical protein